MYRLYVLLLLISFISCKGQKPLATAMAKVKTPFELDTNTTPQYEDVISYYEDLASHPMVKVNTVGMTDSGYPLHEVVVTNDGIYEPAEISKKGKAILLINNGIHPGEPCGIDASMMLARDLLAEKSGLLEKVTVVIIPVYNIGGCLNRGSYSRANQAGPVEYGFRGNAKNYDLNRDFIKMDSKNAWAFASIFQKWKPQIFIDNHTSNGADYQYVMTLIPTQKDKLHPAVSHYMQHQMLPDLYSSMKNFGYEMTPYVYSMADTPDDGIKGFLDLGRYSSGYAALHHTISFMPETHMLKPYKDRVWSTYYFMESMLQHINNNHSAIIENHTKAQKETANQSEVTLAYELDKERVEKLLFKGYTAKTKPSEVTGIERLYYDRESPYEKEINFYNTYKPTLNVTVPSAYIVPAGYTEVIDRLRANGVEVTLLDGHERKEVEVYYIEDYSSYPRPYEGHYLHYDVQVRKETMTLPFYKGDFVVKTDQPTRNFIMATLEPQAPDSYFAWNFFDGILMQKEHFSAYVFEDVAADLLSKDADLKKRFEEKKKTDKEFSDNPRAQLNFIYKHSPYYEPTHMRYPVVRVVR